MIHGTQGRSSGGRPGLRQFLLVMSLASGLLLADSVQSAPAPAVLAGLLDHNDWFALRDSIESGDAPPLYRGAAACAFNEADSAQACLRRVLRAAPASDDAVEARMLLAILFDRAGQFHRALAEVDSLLAVRPDAPGASQWRERLAAWARYPDAVVVRLRPSTMRFVARQDPVFNWFMPVTIGGRAGSFIVDTGASTSMLSASEARRLGLVPEPVPGVDTSAAGIGLRTQWTVAPVLTVGGCKLKNVPFVVMPDDVAPFSLLAPGERGVIGLPVLLALRTLRWDRDGTFSVGFAPGPRNLRAANLCFRNRMPLAEASYHGVGITLELDTGAGSDFLYPRFAREFSSQWGDSARKDSMRIGGVGGDGPSLESLTLPEVPVRVGGLVVSYRPARVLLQEIDPGTRRYHGLLGLPVLSQARRVTLDFGAMMLTLE